jgi:hypothetical protein
VTIAIWTFDPDLDWSFEAIDPVEILRMAPMPLEQRVSLAPREFRRYQLPLSVNKTTKEAIEAFLLARRSAAEAFFFREPLNGWCHEAGISLGTGDGIETTFALPTTGNFVGFYPIDNANLVGKVDGSPATVASVQTEARTITFSAAPGNTLAVTLDCDFYRLVRLEERFEFVSVAPDFWRAVAPLSEVVDA